jgi:branched-chain amino acid transport system substrate-binding protein
VKPVLYEGLTRGEKDFSAVVTKIRSTGADVVYFGGLHPEAGPLVRQLREQGLKDVKFMSDDGIVTDELVTTAGGAQYVDGVYMTFGADPRLLPDSKAVVEEFRKAAPSRKATPCTPTLRCRPWPPASTAPSRTRAKTPPSGSRPTRSRPSWARKVGQQGRPDRLRLRGLPVGQDGKYHQLEKQK